LNRLARQVERGTLGGSDYVFCEGAIEDRVLLFFYCPEVKSTWNSTVQICSILGPVGYGRYEFDSA